MGHPFLSVVIPAFNEDSRIGLTLERIVSYLGRQDYAWEVLVVDDGSTDGTSEIADEWANEVRGVRLERVPHGGKGWAVKNGMLAATGDYRFMCDADLAMPIEQLGVFIDRITDGHDIVIGSRQIYGARRYDEPLGRHIMGRIFNRTVGLLAVRGFDDTQCGFKCFRGDVAEELFGLQESKGFGFDVELLYIGRKRGLSVLEIPIDWYHQQSSKVRPVVDSLAMGLDTARQQAWTRHGLCALGPFRMHGTGEIVPTDAAARPYASRLVEWEGSWSMMGTVRDDGTNFINDPIPVVLDDTGVHAKT